MKTKQNGSKFDNKSKYYHSIKARACHSEIKLGSSPTYSHTRVTTVSILINPSQHKCRCGKKNTTLNIENKYKILEPFF